MYSIDKVKIIIYGIKIEIISFLLDELSKVIDKDLIYYESKAVSKCYHNFMFNGIYLGIDNNWNKKFESKYKNVVMEWNPNKVDLDFFVIRLDILFEDLKKIEVMSFDVAYDLEVPISNLIVLKQHELQRMNILSHSTVETYYIGRFNDNGFCRIYDKAKESKLDYPLTRIEVHLTKVGFIGYYDSILELKLPTVLMVDDDIDVTGTNKALILACYQMPHLLSLLDKRKRKQIKELMKSNLKKVDISVQGIMNTCLNFKFI